MTRADFRNFHAALGLSQGNYKFASVAYVENVPASKLAQHQASVRHTGQADYQVSPVGTRPVYAPIVYIEPPDADNRRALGFDVFSVGPARAAMEQVLGYTQFKLSKRTTAKSRKPTAKAAAKTKGKRNAT